MDFNLSEEQQLFADTNRRFLADTYGVEAVRKLSETQSGQSGIDPDWWRDAAELGWVSLLVSEQAGGMGLGGEGILYLGLLAEEMGRQVSPGPLIPSNLVAATLSRCGQSAFVSEALGEIMSGEATAAWCLCEDHRHWRLEDLTMGAKRSDGAYRVRGIKTPVESAGEARYLLLTARMDGEPVQFLARANAPGVSIEPLQGLDMVRRFALVRFNDVRLEEWARIESSEGAAQDIERQMQLALALQSAESAGAADRVLEFTLEWAFDRYSFGRPLASYQALKHRFANMKTSLETCHATASGALHALADGSNDAPRLTRIANAYVGEHAPEIVQDCVQMHGGIGVTWEHDIHMYLRRVASNRVIYGKPHAQRAAVANLLEI